MKNVPSDFVAFLIFTLLLFFVLFIPAFLGVYNTQKDREMFVKTYEMVVECRKNIGFPSADKICGELPTFVNKVS
jgi:cell division protein FtsL